MSSTFPIPSVSTFPLVETFKISSTSLGLLSSIYFYSYAALQLVVGVLTDRWRPRKILTVCIFIMTLGTLIYSYSPSFTRDQILVAYSLLSFLSLLDILHIFLSYSNPSLSHTISPSPKIVPPIGLLIESRKAFEEFYRCLTF